MKLLTALLGLVVALATATAANARDVALIVANAGYVKMGPLANPTNDARRMRGVLEGLGFEVQVSENLGRAQMLDVLTRFAQTSRGADTAMIFYSGHGFEADGVNYLIPVDFAPKHPDDVRFMAVRLEDAMDAVAGAARLSVVILDACRDNPLATGTRGGSRGLARVTARPSQVVAYSTAPGRVAMDGAGATSPYTQALAETIEANPAMDVRRLFTSLSSRTTQLARAEQIPYAEFGAFSAAHVSLDGRTPRPVAAPAPAPAAGDASVMLAMWDAVKDAGDARALDDFAKRFPDSPLAAEAARRSAALAAPKPAPTGPNPQDGRRILGVHCRPTDLTRAATEAPKRTDFEVDVRGGRFVAAADPFDPQRLPYLTGTLAPDGAMTMEGRMVLDGAVRDVRFTPVRSLHASVRSGATVCDALMGGAAALPAVPPQPGAQADAVQTPTAPVGGGDGGKVETAAVFMTAAPEAPNPPRSAPSGPPPDKKGLLPHVSQIPPLNPLPIDGVWTADFNGAQYRADAGRMIAMTPYMQLGVLPVEPDDVVVQGIQPTAPGTYQGFDLAAQARWKGTLQPDGTVRVQVGMFSTVLRPVSAADPQARRAALAALGQAASTASPNAAAPASQPGEGAYRLTINCEAVRGAGYSTASGAATAWVRTFPVTLSGGRFSLDRPTTGRDDGLQITGSLTNGDLRVGGNAVQGGSWRSVNFAPAGTTAAGLPKASGRRGRAYCEAYLER